MANTSYRLVLLALCIVVITATWALMLRQHGVGVLDAALSGVAVGYLMLQIIKQLAARMARHEQQRGVAHE